MGLREELYKINPHFTSSEIDVIEYEYAQGRGGDEERRGDGGGDGSSCGSGGRGSAGGRMRDTRVIEDQLNGHTLKGVYGARNDILRKSDNTINLSPIVGFDQKTQGRDQVLNAGHGGESKFISDSEKILQKKMQAIQRELSVLSEQNDR